MRTTVNIDDEKGKELMQITSAPSMSKAIQMALAEYIDMKRKKQLLALRGKLDIIDNWQELRRMDAQDPPHE
ncbi:type II toxin-antitoxin system VapB family antitoxin [Geoalkalibacter sp.]|uniref:type II toxin-antitoxin system VapB family antitoxin n=1 Tax=Geoalkalibacter sp. TaxID=3041440 RepID=UPI00272DE772|nr:type II toxin-antitoxin system VapB family antitoxin [Geoalkalibacter sp.]